MSRPLYRCPTCRRELAWDASNPFRPFCSDRCRLIDLGAWLKEEHAIAGEPATDLTGRDEDGAPAIRH